MSVIADDKKRIDTNKLKRSSAMAEMLDKGWCWDVLAWQVSETWPSAPEILQRAFNASHSVGSDASELEVAVTVADQVEAQIAQGLEPDFGAATKEATAGNPQCTSYAPILATLVELYGGGPSAPIVRKLDDLGKIH